MRKTIHCFLPLFKNWLDKCINNNQKITLICHQFSPKGCPNSLIFFKMIPLNIYQKKGNLRKLYHFSPNTQHNLLEHFRSNMVDGNSYIIQNWKKADHCSFGINKKKSAPN